MDSEETQKLLVFEEDTSEIVYNFDQTSQPKVLYWTLPPDFLGNKVFQISNLKKKGCDNHCFPLQIHSYFGNMTFFVRFNGKDNRIDSKEENPLIVLKGNGITLHFMHDMTLNGGQEEVLKYSLNNYINMPHCMANSNVTIRNF